MNEYQQAINVALGSSYIDENEIPPVKANTWYSDLLLSVSEDAQILLEILISTPIEIASSSYSGCQRIERYMKANFNWSYQKTAKAFYEVKRCIHES